MPYRHAWVFVLALIGATLVAFWRSYFGKLTEAPLGFHIHGITATLWMLLLAAQSWTPHHRRLALHRTLGLATFAAVPLFAAGAMGVLHSMAAATVGGDPFYALWGAQLALIDAVALGGFLYIVALGLRHRRQVRAHSAHMLATALMLISPILGRLANQTIPGLIIRGPQDFHLFGTSVQLGNAAAGAVALWLWRRDPRNGRAWAIAAVLVALQMIGFATIGTTGAWRAMFVTVGTLPLPLLLIFGALAGMVAVWFGWNGGRRETPRAVAR